LSIKNQIKKNTMATKSKKKGKTMALTDFLAGDSKLVTVRGANWSEIVDSEEAEAKPIGTKSQTYETKK